MNFGSETMTEIKKIGLPEEFQNEFSIILELFVRGSS